VKDQVIIITGGSSGMGFAMARRFAKEGSRVVITGRDQEKLAKAQEEIQQERGQVLAISMDVRQPEQVQRMVEQTKETFGRIDGLINNAAGNFIVRAEDLSINGWNAVVQIVLNGTWYCSQAVAKEWIASGTKGSILNIIATYAWTGCPGVVHSAAAKAGVLAMSKTLAVEWGRRYGIRVNCIAPGFVEGTGGAERLIQSEEMFERIRKSIPLGRMANTEEIARLACFLMSPEAEYINGDCITIDAGASLGQGWI
jgi:NAD(P)-dependent dehydrogenase (short-subunit alcohol dehydrogenase family)